MIENDQQLEATFQALGCLYRAVASLRQQVLPVNRRQYALFAEGPVDEIQKLQSEINAYLGLDNHSARSESSEPADPAHAVRETPPKYGSPDKG